MKRITLLLFASLFICQITFSQRCCNDRVRGQGPTITERLRIAPFSGIVLAVDADVYVCQDNRYSVKVEGQENVINSLSTNIVNGTWKIKFNRRVRGHSGLKIYITMPTIRKAFVSGSGSIEGDCSFRRIGDLLVGISGSGDIKLDVDANNIDARINGSGDLKLKGHANRLEVNISGSGDIHSHNLDTAVCDVNISGSGNCDVNVERELTVRISGSGNVDYHGRPNVRSRISGSGNIRTR